ncbi:MAG: plastocyanin/azurin family copper-binding protein [Acidimicrobiia bacterium]|nr:plastocyanin/azurin family copper-binding protein [Acidimicrobiia bacterium]
MAVVAGVVLSACGGGATAPSDGGGAVTSGDSGSSEVTFDDHSDPVEFEDHTGEESVEVEARDNVFEDTYLEISPGTEVVFINKGRNDHNVYPANEGAFPEIETSDLTPGESASITFDEPGDFPYYCTLHATETAGMIGGVRVTAD